MQKPSNKKFSPHLVLAATLSGALTIGFSLIYILLCIAAIILRLNCDNGVLLESATGADYFWKIVFSAFILESDCPASLSVREPVNNDITEAYTVFVLTTITLSISVLSLITAISLITTIQDNATRYINLVVSAYIGVSIASLIVDLTTAAHFGLDYGYLTTLMESWPAGADDNYKTEVLRQGALILMSIALKGYIAPVINIILIILLVVYAVEHKTVMKSNEHSIHKLGALTAFDQPRKPDNWSTQPELLSPFSRGAQMNNGFMNDDESPPRTPNREPNHNNYSNRSFDRSDSWHHSQPNAPGSRPFTYLEDLKRPVPARPPPSPAVEPPWRRDQWPPSPLVPAPDYSPQPARRLKSALKPAYM